MIRYTLNKIAEIVDGELYGNPEAAINGVEIDSRIIKNDQLFVPLIGETHNGHSFVRELLDKGVIASLWQKGEPDMPEDHNIIVVEDVVSAIAKLAAYYRQHLKAKVIGVTGSSGKTSSKDMISSVLSAKYKVHKTPGNKNNEIGVPLTILSIDEEDEIAVIEMGISDFGEMDMLVEMVRPDVTVITSIAPAHILYFKTLDNIVHEKCLINSKLGAGQCFYNNDAYGLKAEIAAQNLLNKPISYGFEEDSDYQITSYQYCTEGMSFTLSGYEEPFELPVLSKHLILNAAGAVAIGKYFGLSIDEIKEGLSHLSLTPHRMQLLHINGAMVIDDAYNSNPGSLVAALEFLSASNNDFHKVVVLGDMLELGEESGQLHGNIGDQVDFRAFDEIYLVGEEMANLRDNLAEKGITSHYSLNNEGLVQALLCHLRPGNVILFKASNGMRFISLISELEEKANA